MVSYVFPPPAFVLVLAMFLAEHDRSIQTSYSSGTLLAGGFLASHSYQHNVGIPHCCHIIKNLVMDVSGNQVLRGLPLLHLTL